MAKNKQIFLNMFTRVASFAISLAINFFLTPIIIGKIGKEVYGFYGLAENFLEYATIITLTVNGMANRYITVAYSKHQVEEANKYFTSVTAVNIFFTLILSVPAVVIVAFIDRFINVPLAHITDIKVLWTFIFSMFFVELIFSRYEVAEFAMNRLDVTAMISVFSMLIRVVLLCLAYTLLTPYISYIGIIVFACAVFSAAAKVYYKKRLTPDLKFDKKFYSIKAITELAKVGIWNSISQVSQMLFTGLDLLIANLFIGAAGMGLLSVAKLLPVMIIGFIGVIAGAFYPTMTISYSTSEQKDFIKETNFASKLCGFICSVPIIGIIVFGKIFFKLWLPALTDSDIAEVQILSILTLLPQTLSLYVFPLHQINTITCKVKIPALVDCAIGVANIAIVYILLKTTNLGLYAIAGVSSALLILRILIFLPLYAAHNVKAKKGTFYPLLLRGIGFNLILLTVFLAVGHVFSISGWIKLIAASAVCAVIGYIAGFAVLFSKPEQQKAISFFKNKLTRRSVGD